MEMEKKFEEFDVTFQNEIVILKEGREVPLRHNILDGRRARVICEANDGQSYFARLYNPHTGKLQQTEIRIPKS